MDKRAGESVPRVAGMNRGFIGHANCLKCVPRVAGMNRISLSWALFLISVPRVAGMNRQAD